MTPPPPTSSDPDALARGWAEILDAEPHTWIRDAAARLGVSEAELLATRCGENVERLRLDLPALLPRLESLGRLMGLTRNDAFVMERYGVYAPVYPQGPVFSVAGPEIDLRIFTRSWHHAFAQTDTGAHGERLSLHFFDAGGDAVHKIYSAPETDQGAFRALVEAFLHEDQGREQSLEPEGRPAPGPGAGDRAAARATSPRPDGQVDVATLESRWRALTDTHAFNGLLRELQVGRTQALRLVDDELARPTPVLSLRTVLETAAAESLPLVVFVKSPGAFQIHHGPVHDVREARGWFNVLDPEFNLHVLESAIDAAWVVRKPVEPEAGWVTSLEFYDGDGEILGLIFGGRERGAPEPEAWTALLHGLPRP